MLPDVAAAEQKAQAKKKPESCDTAISASPSG
jgi:hypothetical protein